MRTPSRRLALAAVLTLAAAPAAPAAGQAVTHVVSDPGWVGVSITVRTVQDGAGPRSSATVTDVSAGSPAYQAGIRAGDVLLSVNGRPSLPRGLRVGDTVHMVFRRDGERRVVTLTAAPRPADLDDVPTLTVTVRDESMADRMYLAMDSVRARLASGADPGPALVGVGDVFRLRGSDDTAFGVWTPSELRPPFGFYIFRGEAHDSLMRAMEQLNGDIRRVRSERAARVRQLARVRGDETHIDVSDPELVRLRHAMVELDRRSSELREAMERAAQRQPGDPYVGPFSAVFGTDETDQAEHEARFRPLDVYLLGQNRAAGAEVVDLRPELAEYFEVEGGVLVVDVAEGTPAALAGVQPGDVLTHIGSLPVLSIQELRKGLASTGSEIPVTVVRKGKRLQLLLVR